MKSIKTLLCGMVFCLGALSLQAADCMIKSNSDIMKMVVPENISGLDMKATLQGSKYIFRVRCVTIGYRSSSSSTPTTTIPSDGDPIRRKYLYIYSSYYRYLGRIPLGSC